MQNYWSKIRLKIKRLLSKQVSHISISPDTENGGSVLLSYLIKPLFLKKEQLISRSHTNQWECWQIAKTFIDFGYSVDAINWFDKKFIPKKRYSFFIDIHSNLERIAPLINQDCVKILHITGAHWLFQNQAEYQRLLALQQRRGVTLIPRRVVPPSRAIEYADFATVLGNQFTIQTFGYANKLLHRIPISTTNLYQYPEAKNYQTACNRFLWFGSSGMVHKGLDLVLEAFAEMPTYHLTVCGPVDLEKDFEQAFYRELYETQNINTIGWVDVSSQQFIEITNSCIALIYPSCSEGGGGSVVLCMHAGLIPILSYESSVDIGDFGFVLNHSSIEDIKKTIQLVAKLPPQELQARSRRAWEFARRNHTRETFAKAYNQFVAEILTTAKNV